MDFTWWNSLKIYLYLLLIGQGCFNWKRRFREMIFQTKRVTSSAGGDLVYPSKALFLNHVLITISMIIWWWVKCNTEQCDCWTCCQYGLPASTETVDIPIKPKPGTQEIRGWIRGWWMEPEHYKVSPLNIKSHCDNYYLHPRASQCCTCMASPTVVPTTTESDYTRPY